MLRVQNGKVSKLNRYNIKVQLTEQTEINVRKWFKPKRRSLIGIDIRPTSIKCLEISNDNSKRCIENYIYRALPAPIFDANLEYDIDFIASNLGKVLQDINALNKSIVLAVPDSFVISKTIQLNKNLTNAEMAEFCFLEMDKSLNYPLDKICIDFHKIGLNSNNQTIFDILIVASKLDCVNKRVEILHRAGFEATIIDVESFALIRALKLLDNNQDKIILLIEIGFQSTHFLFLLDGKVLQSREETIGSKLLVDFLAKQYASTFTEVLARQLQNAIPKNDMRAAFHLFVEQFLLQLKSCIQFFFSTQEHSVLDHIYLAGELFNLTGLASIIQNDISIKTSIVNPFKQFEVSKLINLKMLRAAAPSLLLACGLALRDKHYV